MNEKSKCPFTGAGTPPKFPTGRGTSNRDWWPNSLNLKILNQHSSLVDPMDKKFNYAKEFKKLNLKALKKDLHKLMTDSPVSDLRQELIFCSSMLELLQNHPISENKQTVIA